MADILVEFFQQLFLSLNVADGLLMGLVGLFVVSGFIYKVKNDRECAQIRSNISKQRTALNEIKGKEKQQKEELQRILNAQNANMARINTLKKRKAEISRMPVRLDKELEELVAWCHREKISVNFDRREAARRRTPPGRRI